MVVVSGKFVKFGVNMRKNWVHRLGGSALGVPTLHPLDSDHAIVLCT